MNMRTLLINILYARAKRYVELCRPIVIAVTGSHGKTTTKNAIAAAAHALYPSRSIRQAKKSFNNEFGVPLSILGEESPGRSIFGWLGLLWRLFRLNAKDCPEVLILEYGADRPGEIEHWCKLAAPDIGVITGVSAVHAANYPGGISDVIQEKSTLAKYTKQVLVLNGDDAEVEKMKSHAGEHVKTVFYGEKSNNLSFSMNIEMADDGSFDAGETFMVTRAELGGGIGQGHEMHLRNLIGYAPVMSSLAAILAVNALAEISDRQTTLQEIIISIEDRFGPTPGRLRPIAGIKKSLIIDDSYNAAPAAMVNGLHVLQSIPVQDEGRRIAVLGKMAELGEESEQAHYDIGKTVAEIADTFIAVGEEMKTAKGSAMQFGMNTDSIEWFATSEEAGRYLDNYIQRGDIIYVKGSQSARMEKVVKDIMADPLKAVDLLVRQEKIWLN